MIARHEGINWAHFFAATASFRSDSRSFAFWTFSKVGWESVLASWAG